MNDTLVSLIRTWTPVVVGAVIAFFANRGFDIDINQNVVVAGAIAVYYALARALEKRWPVFGVLLGVPKEPAYRGTPPVQPGA
jgi:uncharacterized membrane protein (DUF441 family)